MSDTESSSSEPPSSSDRAPGDRSPTYAFELCDDAGLLSGTVRARIDTQVRSALDAAGARGDVRVRVVDDTEMARAHEEYLDVEGTTDVLTFDLTGGESAAPPAGSGEPLDVDILICADEAARQAGELGHPVEHEMTLYIVHGVLHCLGFDDITEEGAAAMHTEEDRLLTAAGIGAVFAKPDPSNGASP